MFIQGLSADPPKRNISVANFVLLISREWTSEGERTLLYTTQ